MKIDDIARLANVSKASVSLALNNKKGISEETKRRILDIAEEHGYKPRTYVKTEKTNKVFRFVACTSSGIITNQYESQPFFMELIKNIDQSVSSEGYSLIMSSVEVNELESRLTQLEKEQESDGIILLGTNLTTEQILIVKQIHSNLVILDTCDEVVSATFIVMNNVMGSYQATNHLISHGHTKIGYLQSTTRMFNFEEREKGFRKALSQYPEKDFDITIFPMSPTEVSSQQMFEEKLQQLHEKPTAFIAECDYMAISAMKTFNKLNINVPEDVSIIGFDNIPEAMIVSPELTTIDVNQAEIVRSAIEQLLLNKEEFTKKIIIDTSLINRNSCRMI